MMAKDLPPYEHLVEEEYIDMDVSSTTFLCYKTPSPPHPNSREFEFQMSTNPPERETTTSPADELFYKGKLLPLHLPPRLEMVQKLLSNSNISPQGKESDPLEEALVITTTSNNKNNTPTITPFDSCNISPATSCYVSGELNPEDYFHECAAELFQSHSKKSWSKKFKLIRHSSLGLKLKASRAYLRSLFTKSGRSNESSAAPQPKGCANGYMKPEKKNQFWKIQKERSMVADTNAKSIGQRLMEDDHGHRKSFSGAINLHFTTRSSSETSSCSSSSSSSFSSANSGALHGPHMLKRSSSVNSEMENSIQGAIAHCKMSQQLISGRKSLSDIGCCSLSASTIAAVCKNQESPGLCRG